MPLNYSNKKKPVYLCGKHIGNWTYTGGIEFTLMHMIRYDDLISHMWDRFAFICRYREYGHD